MYPSLADVTLEGIPSVRNLISDLAMDVLLYQSAYCDHIATIVQQECNRILSLFKKRNPSFQGSVSLCGHSLGSAILFDILCNQQTSPASPDQESAAAEGNHRLQLAPGTEKFPLDFECEELFCLGSPIALFQMLKGKTIAGRCMPGNAAGSIGSRGTFDASDPSAATHIGLETGLDSIPPTVSSPKCQQLYNIFHPSDPVSYRIEPLISPATTALKPQPLPSVKRSLWTASGQSLSVIGSRVGQHVGTLWTNITSGVASSLLNRSLGLNSDNVVSRVPADDDPGSRPRSTSGNDSNNGTEELGEGTVYASQNQRFETLYHGFQEFGNTYKRDLPAESSGSSQNTDNRHARKMRVEDAKVRALNSNGRVDYNIQE